MLCALGLAGLVGLSLVDKGATRMYAFPWWLLFWFVQLVPVAALLVRAAFDRRPLMLPTGAWWWLPVLLGAVEFAAALASPFRAQSLLAVATPLAALAAFLLVFDALHHSGPEESAVRQTRLARALSGFFLVVLADSLGLWWWGEILPALTAGRIASLQVLFNFRNGHPLGHSNYTAGLAVFMLPWLAEQAWRARGRRRAGWVMGAGLALFVLFTSGSRGGMIGLTALLVAVPVLGRRRGILSTSQTMALAAAALLLCAGFALVNPRIRGLLAQETASGPPDESTSQRSAMLAAGYQMGRDRPLLGFGPGVTPLVYPRYRALLSGGVATALQLHCTPVQLWADTGLTGLLVAAGMVALIAGALWKNSRPAAPALALAAYGVFAFSDFELDVPVFAFLVAICAAACAPPPQSVASAGRRHGLALAVLAITALITALGRSDPTPALNVEAVTVGRDPAQADRAVALLRQSLAINPDQGIAQFNLGWLLVARDPSAAERHFLAAAHLWPDKSGVYFGLGLARLNQNRSDDAARAFALECINNPPFAASPWWRVPGLAPLRAGTAAQVAQIYGQLITRFPAERWLNSEVKYAAALEAWLFGLKSGREIAALATTAPRRDFFRRDPSPAALLSAPIRHLRYEEPGYPVVMRNPDLPTPVDLFEDQENAFATGQLRFLFPLKGWLPSPPLLEFLDNSGRSEK